jgi:subtilisin family serine protease
VSAGRQTKDYIGAAPGAELIVVKVRRAHQYFIDELTLPPDKPNYFHNADVMLGIQYIIDISREMNAPVVICNGLGSNDAGHDGYTMFEEYISWIGQRAGYAVVNAAGNESNAKHHTQGILFRTGSTDVIGIRVGEPSASFSMNIFGAAYDKISVGITSPTGEIISRVPFNVDVQTKEELTFEKTTVSITYYRAVNTVITIGFKDAKEGIWEITLYGDSILGGEYHAWLPITYQVSPEVQFMKPVPEYTIVYPGNSLRSITCGAYELSNNSLYVSSSWGPTRLPRMAPDFVAPGVNVSGIYPTGAGSMTGTSVAAAIASGAAAILMEWGIVQGNYLSMDGDVVRLLLISGCKRDEAVQYPNIKWGYGKLDLYGTLWGLRESNTRFNTPEGTP